MILFKKQTEWIIYFKVNSHSPPNFKQTKNYREICRYNSFRITLENLWAWTNNEWKHE